MNLGRTYPKCNRPDIQPHFFTRDDPPYKWRYMSTSVAAGGTLAQPWLGQQIISEEYTLEPDGQRIAWKLNHPTVADNFIKMSWGVNIDPGSNPKAKPWIRAEFWHQGTKYGDVDRIFSVPSEVFLGAQSLCFQNITWFNLVNPALFQFIQTSFYFAAQWAFVPDYKPYDTRP